MTHSSFQQRVSSVFPILDWLPEYHWKRDLFNEIKAGLGLALWIIPQSLAYATLAGLPPVHGLYTSLVGPLLYVFIGGGKTTIVALAPLISFLLHETAFQLDGTYSITKVWALTFWSGVIQILLGAIRADQYIYEWLLPSPTRRGLIAASSLLIFTSQLSTLLGMIVPEFDPSIGFLSKWWFVLNHLTRAHWPTLILSLIALFILFTFFQHQDPILSQGFSVESNDQETIPLFGGRVATTTTSRWTSRNSIPGGFLALVLGSLIVWLFRLDILGVSVIGSVPQGLPVVWKIHLKDLGLSDVTHFANMISSSTLIAIINHGFNGEGDRGLLVSGLSTMVSSLFQAIPVTGDSTRSQLHSILSPVTQLTPLFTVCFISLFISTSVSLLWYIPFSVLSAIITARCLPALVLGVKDANRMFRQYFSRRPPNLSFDEESEPRHSFAMWLGTTLAILLLGLVPGLKFGIFISVVVRYAFANSYF